MPSPLPPNQPPSRPLQRAGVLLCAAAAVWLTAPGSTRAQYPEARISPRGVLMIDFSPSYVSYSNRFAANGDEEPLGTDFSDERAGVRLIPSMWSPEGAIGSIIGDAGYTIDAGAFRTTLDADIRRFPLNLEFGISKRFSVWASVPLVSTRMQVDFRIDSTATSDMGENLAGTSEGEGAIRSLIVDLDAGAAFVESQIAAGAYGCPGSAQCAEAQALVDRANQLVLDLEIMTGVFGAGGTNEFLPPFAPIDSSAAGKAVLAAVEDVKADLVTFGAPAIGGTVPLPPGAVDTTFINDRMLQEGRWGYGAEPLTFVKYHLKLGDAELGLRWGAVQSRSLRAVVEGKVRLPTGAVDLAENFVDLGVGDEQTDIVLGAQAVWEPGSVLALAASASYTLQLGHQLERRITPHTSPIAIAATQQTVSRNLGDVFEMGLYPTLRLSRSFVVYGSVYYYFKPKDSFELTGPYSLPDDQLQTSIEDLEFQTKMTALSFGGGIHYFADTNRDGLALPIAAGIDYRAAFQGEGGLTPKSSRLNFYLRLYWRWFGDTPTEN